MTDDASSANTADDPARAPRPAEVAQPLTNPLAIAGSLVVGAAMGAAEVVPGFSGGTVALVFGIYERLIANIRQGARVLSLLIRGRWAPARRAVLVIEWPFVGALLAGMAVTIATLAGVLGELIDTEPMAMSAVFLGLVLGAAAVASTQFHRPRPRHGAVVVLAAAATFVGLGLTPGTVAAPGLPLLFAGVAVAACAWILPGVSGAFLLLVVGLYPATLAAVETRDVVALVVMVAGAVTGLAVFATALNWLLARAHDLVLAVMLGLMIGSARVLWPWPSNASMGDASLASPEAGTVPLVVALVAGAFAAVWIFGLIAGWVHRRRQTAGSGR